MIPVGIVRDLGVPEGVLSRPPSCFSNRQVLLRDLGQLRKWTSALCHIWLTKEPTPHRKNHISIYPPKAKILSRGLVASRLRKSDKIKSRRRGRR